MPYHLATAPALCRGQSRDLCRGYERPHPLRDELHALHAVRIVSGSGGKKAPRRASCRPPDEPGPHALVCRRSRRGCRVQVHDRISQHFCPARASIRGHQPGSIQVQKAQNPPTSVSGDGRLLRWVEKSIYRLNHPAPEMEHLPHVQ
jgi:hypothetical protein